MKAFVCFAIGLLVGAVTMKKNQTIDELKRELEREKSRNTSGSRPQQT